MLGNSVQKNKKTKSKQTNKQTQNKEFRKTFVSKTYDHVELQIKQMKVLFQKELASSLD